MVGEMGILYTTYIFSYLLLLYSLKLSKIWTLLYRQPDSRNPSEGLQNFKMDSSKITPPGITTTVANQAQKTMGDRPTTTTNTPNMRPDSTQLTLQWWGNKGKLTP
jgi:hypothetical protein